MATTERACAVVTATGPGSDPASDLPNSKSHPKTAIGVKAKSWRDVYPVHPCADLFPLMPKTELRGLADDIKKNGLHIPVVFFNDPTLGVCLLDGRNRLDAIELNGNNACDAEVDVIEGDPLDYVLSTNFRRRHLSSRQKRELIAKLLKLDPIKSNRAFADMTGISDKTFASERRRLEANSEIPNSAERIEASGRKARGVKPGTKTALVKEIEGLTAHVQDLEAARQDPPRQTKIEKLTAENDILKKRISALEFRLSLNGDLCDFGLSTADEIALTMVQHMGRTKFQDICKRGLEYFKAKDAGLKPRKIAAEKPSATPINEVNELCADPGA